MDYISSFDIRLAKEIYYAGERISGSVVLENTENIKIKGIRVLLRGKVHATLKVVKSGERRTIKDDQYVLDEKLLIWGKDKNDESEGVPILARGLHQFPFSFDLPQTTLPCSLESRHGTIRYYIKVIIDIPYASSPQGIKYFTIIGPHLDCMEEKYLSALSGQDRKTTCCLCCRRGALALRVVLDRTAYVCGENIRVRAQVENRQSSQQMISIRLIQHVEFFIDKGVLGESKMITLGSNQWNSLFLSMTYLFSFLSNESLHLEFPLTVATVPYRIPNAPHPPMEYEFCANHVEGGKYVSPEFRLGQVYDGEGDLEEREEEVVLYRPVYAKLAERRLTSPSAGKDFRSVLSGLGGATRRRGTFLVWRSPQRNSSLGLSLGIDGEVVLMCCVL
ncbi:unnamed protein product [Haemonchus placei]|uniref:Arrestin_C domain-containing protein n=1 Tax=Haemonchus placei TaxID=6290 RepID=A0A0N4X2M0_HAEPC|nr:unnamed protein product [Haemonchus placei]